MENKRTRVIAFDRMRVFAIIGVIYSCISNVIVIDGAADSQPLTLWWHIANFLDAASQFAVPLLLMALGAILLEREDSGSVKDVWRYRIFHMAIPLVIWSVIYMVFRFLWQGFLQEELLPVEMIRSVFNQPMAEHLKLIYLLLALYIILPFLRLIVAHMPRKAVWYAVGIWGFYCSVWPTVSGLFPNLALPAFGDLNMLAGYAGYMLLGWLLATTDWSPSPTWMLAGYGISVLVTSIGTALLTREAGTSNLLMFQAHLPNVVAMTVCAFMFCREFDRRTVFSPWLSAMAKYSLGMYFIFELYALLLIPIVRALPAIISLIVAPPIVWLLSLISVAFMRRVKIIRVLFFGERYHPVNESKENEKE